MKIIKSLIIIISLLLLTGCVDKFSKYGHGENYIVIMVFWALISISLAILFSWLILKVYLNNSLDGRNDKNEAKIIIFSKKLFYMLLIAVTALMVIVGYMLILR